MKGSMLDFLHLVAKNPELLRGLVKLAAEYDFEFAGEELTEEELGAIAGGAITPLQYPVEYTSKFLTTITNIVSNGGSNGPPNMPAGLQIVPSTTTVKVDP